MSTFVEESRRAAADLRPLIEFRVAGMRSRGHRRARTALAIFAMLTVAVATIPSFVPSAYDSDRATDIVLLMPTAYLAFLLTTTLAVVGSGGGRELLPRDQAVAYPLSPTTDHLGALLLAPLNIAWIIQVWFLLATTAYVVRPQSLLWVQLTLLLWVLTSTAVAQCAAWGVEWIRRGPHGVALVRLIWFVLGAGLAALVAFGRLGDVLDGGPGVSIARVVFSAGGGNWIVWPIGVLGFVALGVAAVALGASLAHAVSRRTARDEAKVEGQTYAPRPMPSSELAALIRTDRASVLRSLPLRRGLIVLALLPGLVAAGGQLGWDMLPILPGLVAAGGALLFGINAWCLDGVGALWRDSLPVDPRLAFVARAFVLFEILMMATLGCLAIAALRAGGLPTSAELSAVLATVVVVSLQVVARSMQWSVRRPYAMDLRSARGTPAPPFAMFTYSGWLAFSSTMTGLVFGLTARAADPSWAIVMAVPFVLAAVRRILISLREWNEPERRARVVATVSAR